MRRTGSPDIFIGLAEEIGLIDALGQHILRIACRDALVWTQSNPSPFMLSVNVSPRQISSGDLACMVITVLDETGFHPGNLLLEATESAPMNEPSVQTTIAELRNLAQGYLWTQPVEAEQVAELLEYIGKARHAVPSHAHHKRPRQNRGRP